MLILSVFSLAGAWAQTIVMNENELRSALTDGANIKLATDITLSTTLIIQDNKTVTIDMSGFELNRGLKQRVLNVGQAIGVRSGSISPRASTKNLVAAGKCMYNIFI